MTKAASASKKFTFYTQTEYHSELVTLIRRTKPGERVLLMSMTFEPLEPEIAAIIQETEAAAARGVHVSLAIDAHSFMMDTAHVPGPLWLRKKMPTRMRGLFQNKLRLLEAINAHATGHADILNMPTRSLKLTVAGRSHIKAAIINDRVFLGGCNLQGSSAVDMMVGWRDTAVSDRLHTTLLNIIHRGHTGQALSWVDRSIPVAENTDILIDSGLRGQSLIFDEALQLIDAAEKWLVITCQFFPNSITARHLAAAAKRGVKVEIIYSHPKNHGLIGGAGQQISILRERTRVPKALFQHALKREDPMLHAKLIACDKGVMIGSHNYVKAGVILGTAEIALKNNDEFLAREAVKTLHRALVKTQ